MFEAGIGETLTHKVFEAGVGSEEVRQRLRLGMAQQGETVQLDDVVDSQGGCVLDLPTTTKQQCNSAQGRMGRGGGGSTISTPCYSGSLRTVNNIWMMIRHSFTLMRSDISYP